ncbi:MAG: VIT domain-containing protein [Singulisphaera sp.]
MACWRAVVLRQTFVNATGEPLEATYIFPLPDRAAVTGFRMEVAGRVVEGVLEERGQAPGSTEAVSEGRRASIAEAERPGVFTIRVGNLMPGDEATVQFTMSGSCPTPTARSRSGSRWWSPRGMCRACRSPARPSAAAWPLIPTRRPTPRGSLLRLAPRLRQPGPALAHGRPG